MNDPIFVSHPSMPEFEEYIKEIKPIWDSAHLTNMGPIHQKFERQLLEYLKISNLQLFANGHSALETCIKAFNLTGEVITTPFTFASTTHAIVNNGLTPIFCDINPIDYTIDPLKIESLITEKTSAIVAVHVYGNICDLDAIQTIAQKYNLKVIYDAAHAFGVTYKNLGIGNFGDASMFSFHATKVFNSIEGGAIACKNPKIAENIRLLKNFGIFDEVTVKKIGINAKMNEFQAAMGICNLKHIDGEIEKRKKIVLLYRSLLENIPGISLLDDQRDVKTNYSYFPIVVDPILFGKNRDEIHNKLKTINVFSRKYFYPLTTQFSCYSGCFKADTPIAEYISSNILALPIYADLPHDIVEKICINILE